MRDRLAITLISLMMLPSICLAGGSTKPYRLAVASFDFNDTSGEPTNQDSKHAAFLASFDEKLNSSLTSDASFAASRVVCSDQPCSLAKSGLQTLVAAASATGADYLLIGQIQKMSTLVGWAKFAVVETATGKPVCDRFLTYRGDTEEAWTRAAVGVGRDIKLHCLK